MSYPFLSDEWIAAARAIREKYADRVPDVEADLRVNLVLTDVPFDEDTLRAHLDTTTGGVVLEVGHLDEPDATVTTDYGTAQSLFVMQDLEPADVMAAFMNGQIKIQGDMMKLMAMQVLVPADDLSEQVAQEMKDITES